MSTDLPPSEELFDKKQLVNRHSNFFNAARVEWALRNRANNGLSGEGAVFETRGGELLIHEPAFLRWFLGLSGRAKPRRLRHRRPAARAK